MGLVIVVVDKPGLGCGTSRLDVREAVGVEELVAKAAVKRFDLTVLCGLTGLDEVQTDTDGQLPIAASQDS